LGRVWFELLFASMADASLRVKVYCVSSPSAGASS
jgi:hypothetical protein